MYAVMKNGRLLSYQATARAAQRLADTVGAIFRPVGGAQDQSLPDKQQAFRLHNSASGRNETLLGPERLARDLPAQPEAVLGPQSHHLGAKAREGTAALGSVTGAASQPAPGAPPEGIDGSSICRRDGRR